MPQFLILSVLGISIAALGVRQANRSGTIPVFVAAANLEVGQKISPTDIRTQRIAQNEAPKGAIKSADQIVGKSVVRTVDKERVLTVEDFLAAPKTAQGFAQFIPPGHVMVALNLNNRIIPRQGFVMGDRIDILVAGRVTAGGGQSTREAQVLARDLLVIGYENTGAAPARPSIAAAVDDKNPLGLDISALAQANLDTGSSDESQLLLAVKPEQVIPLARIDSEPSYNISVVLHGKHEAETGEKLIIESVPRSQRRMVEVIHGSKSTVVQVP